MNAKKSAMKDVQERVKLTMSFHSNQCQLLRESQKTLIKKSYNTSYEEEEAYDDIARLAVALGLASLILASTGMRHFPSGKPAMTGFISTLVSIEEEAPQDYDLFLSLTALFLRSYKKIVIKVMQDSTTVNEYAQSVFDHFTSRYEYEKRIKERAEKKSEGQPKE